MIIKNEQTTNSNVRFSKSSTCFQDPLQNNNLLNSQYDQDRWLEQQQQWLKSEQQWWENHILMDSYYDYNPFY